MPKTDTHNPFFSVIMPVFNGIPFLKDAVDSVLSQTLDDWELVIVDDDSQDDTWKIMEQYATKDQRIRIIKNQKNVHCAASSNRGIQAARGKWIAILDADDMYSPEYLKTGYRYTQKENHEKTFFSSWYRVMNENKKILFTFKPPNFSNIIQMLKIENFLCHSATIYPKSLWERVGGYPEIRHRGTDRLLWNRFFDAGASIQMIPYHSMCYRIHRGNMTAKYDKSPQFRPILPNIIDHKNCVWLVSLMLKQKMLKEARRAIFDNIPRSMWFDPKISLYILLTYMPATITYFFMWHVRSRLRYILNRRLYRNY